MYNDIKVPLINPSRLLIVNYYINKIKSIYSFLKVKYYKGLIEIQIIKEDVKAYVSTGTRVERNHQNGEYSYL